MDRPPGATNLEAEPVSPTLGKRRRPTHWLYPGLFLLTVLWTWSAGALMSGDSTRLVPWPTDLWGRPGAWLEGLSYALGVILILGAHEMGHYVACRLYRIDATLPLFLPAPNPFGTFGAVIRIRSPFPSRKALFDVGIAGPIAGFVVAIPIVLYGLAHSTAGGPMPEGTLSLSSCLLLDGLYPLYFPAAPTPIHLHPAFVAGWLGLFVTSLNLIPLAQLDGGHILYAVAPRRHESLSRVLLVVMSAVGAASGGYHLVLFALIFAVLGIRHPATLDDAEPLGAGRRVLAGVALGIFVITFIAAPFQFDLATP
ncbi:MAG TPA: site-2 protease family protein [Candidatus Polarisedimenticolia bacterium]|nr:site-2 protease family protein [Candidatus Polarisedimenticolia bacterium]